jgi:hypothetical protein
MQRFAERRLGGREFQHFGSLPLLVPERAIAHPEMSQMVTNFNDADSNPTETLQTEIDKLPGIEKLKYKPNVACGEFDSDADGFFNKTKLVSLVYLCRSFRSQRSFRMVQEAKARIQSAAREAET